MSLMVVPGVRSSRQVVAPKLPWETTATLVVVPSRTKSGDGPPRKLRRSWSAGLATRMPTVTAAIPRPSARMRGEGVARNATIAPVPTASTASTPNARSTPSCGISTYAAAKEPATPATAFTAYRRPLPCPATPWRTHTAARNGNAAPMSRQAPTSSTSEQQSDTSHQCDSGARNTPGSAGNQPMIVAWARGSIAIGASARRPVPPRHSAAHPTGDADRSARAAVSLDPSATATRYTASSTEKLITSPSTRCSRTRLHRTSYAMAHRPLTAKRTSANRRARRSAGRASARVASLCTVASTVTGAGSGSLRATSATVKFPSAATSAVIVIPKAGTRSASGKSAPTTAPAVLNA